MNALTLEMKRLIEAYLAVYAADETVRAVVIQGSAKAFAAGTDLAEMREMTALDHARLRTNDVFAAMRAFPKPLIAAVEGFALGGGCELALNCDMIIAGRGARFGQPEIKVGIMPGAGGTQLLLRTIGRYQAVRLALTGSHIDAEEALRMGMISELVESGDAAEAALRVARDIANMPPLAVKSILAAFRFGQNAPLDDALVHERRLFEELFDTDDQEEGMSAFLERRPAAFKGR
ncbi:enoyl-CoA hydratase-related protein [Rhizorhabdus dicambivorans]|nr:enoyl-CoA hydratase-related protein [Rhizorhabdus dicambivorans]